MSNTIPKPRTPKGGWKQTSSSRYHTVALEADGSVACWGWNSHGQCNVPAGLGQIASVAAGNDYTVALQVDGSVACWGCNSFGQCDVPAGLEQVAAVSAGYDHTVALKADGSVACWGNNDYGQCNVPTGLGQVAQVAAGRFHVAVLETNGSVRCWGDMSELHIPWGLSDEAWLDFVAEYRLELKAVHAKLSDIIPPHILRHREYKGICALQRL